MYNLNIFFFFNDTATTEIYTLSLHDALPISNGSLSLSEVKKEISIHAIEKIGDIAKLDVGREIRRGRSEEHTSELQSRQYLVCRLLLEKKTKQCKAEE